MMAVVGTSGRRRLLLVLGLIAANVVASADGRAQPGVAAKALANISTIQLTTINCLSANASRPTIFVRDVTKGEGREWVVNPQQMHVDSYSSTAVFTVPAGTYTITVGQGGCSDIFDATTIAGRTRVLVIAPEHRIYKDLHEHNAIYGILPFRSMRVELLVCVDRTCDMSSSPRLHAFPAEVEGNAYYINEIPGGQWYLKVYFSNPGKAIIVPIGKTGIDSRYGHYERDFTAAELQKAWSIQRTCAKEC